MLLNINTGSHGILLIACGVRFFTGVYEAVWYTYTPEVNPASERYHAMPPDIASIPRIDVSKHCCGVLCRQVYPTTVRAIGVGACATVAKLAGIVAPLISEVLPPSNYSTYVHIW